MDIRALYSGSAGNLYQVDDLLLEAGVSAAKIKKALGFRLSDVSACFITHEHLDHATGAADLLAAGVDCYMSKGTADSLGLSGHRVHPVKDGVAFSVGAWNVLPFSVVHDAAEPLGFLFGKEGEKLLFVMDSNYLPYQFMGLTHVMLGVNYDTHILKENIRKGLIPLSLGRRIMQNHMSLQTAKSFLLAHRPKSLREIHLLHLSETSSDPEWFRREIEHLIGRPVSIPGDSIF